LTFCAVHNKWDAAHKRNTLQNAKTVDRKEMLMAQTFEDAGRFGKEYMDTSLKSFASLSKGLQAIALEATEYTKKSVEAGNAALEKLVAAKSLEKAIEVQTDYAKTTYEGFVAEATKIGELYAGLFKDVYKPFESVVAKTK
jgi:hypothetical protein